jgi:DNA-binding winged helix-turn-helix (wHTH) protein
MSRTSLCFAAFQLDPDDRRLSREGMTVELSARYLDVLILLVKARGALVTKDRFMDEVWRGVPVTDEALTQAIRTLRRTLGDSAIAPRFIQTLPKHGYRFIAPISAVELEPVDRSLPDGPDRQQFVRQSLAGAGGAALAGGLIGLLYGFVGIGQTHSNDAGGGGAFSLLLVLMLASLVSAAVAGAGIAAGIALSRFLNQQRRQWTVAGGALGGLITGAFANVIGSDAFRLLFGQRVEIAGATEGVILGSAVGLAVSLRNRWPRHIWAIAAGLGASAGLGITLLGGQMMAGSLQALVTAFPSSHFGFDKVGRVLGEIGLGPIGRATTAMLESAVFSIGLVWGIDRQGNNIK